MRFNLANEISDNLRVFRRNIEVFAGILRQVVQQWRIVFASRFSFTVCATRNEVSFVISLPNGPKLIIPVIKEDAVHTRALACETRAEVDSVDHAISGREQPSSRSGVGRVR